MFEDAVRDFIDIVKGAIADMEVVERYAGSALLGPKPPSLKNLPVRHMDLKKSGGPGPLMDD